MKKIIISLSFITAFNLFLFAQQPSFYVTGDKKKLIQWVLKGSVENVPIDGKYYSNNMPAQNYLKDEEIAGILTYIRNSFGNKASAITPTEVKNIRAVTK